MARVAAATDGDGNGVSDELPGGVAKFEYGVETRRQIRDQYFRSLFCGADEYSSYGQLFFVPLADSLKLLLHLGEVYEQNGTDEFEQHLFTMDALIMYFVFMYALMTWTYGIGAPTGLFVPSLAVGAAGGQIVGRIVRAMVMSTGSEIVVDLHTYAVVGAAAVLQLRAGRVAGSDRPRRVGLHSLHQLLLQHSCFSSTKHLFQDFIYWHWKDGSSDDCTSHITKSTIATIHLCI